MAGEKNVQPESAFKFAFKDTKTKSDYNFFLS